MSELRQEQVKLYQTFIDCAQSNSYNPIFLDEVDKHLLKEALTLTVTPTCSCGRFFEQHPTIVEDTEEECLDPFLQTLAQGFCKCFKTLPTNDTSYVRVASKTWLHVASVLGCLEMVKVLVDTAQLEINAVTSLYHFSCLSLAVMQTKGHLVSWLCAHPLIDMNIKAKSELHTPLIDAMLAEKFHIVDILSQTPGIDLNTTNFRKETPLIIAVRMNNARLVRMLLGAGADYSIPTLDGVEPLLLAVQSSHQVVQEFITANVPLNKLNSDGESALTLALRNGSLDIMHVLLTGGADPRANPAKPALVLAASLGHVKILIYLLDTGEDPNQADGNGWTALHHACMWGYTLMVQILLGHGASINTLTSYNSTPLALAVFQRHQAIAELLVHYKCDPNICDNDLDTPLHFAAYHGNRDLVRLLIDSKAQACYFNRIGATPLFNAVVSGNMAVIQLLLPHYTDTELHASSQGFSYQQFDWKSELFYPAPRSLLWIAASRGNVEIVNMLLYAGYNTSAESWIHDRDFPQTLTDADGMEPVKDMLLFHASVPRSLLSLSRCVVRRALGPGKQRQVNQLNSIPRKIKNYISLRDF
ncbi:unnamed protein product [Lymnaea stagnalis]|uniref:SOCS box domain-containing protein n=1 Tax=Lymnaea stagnalis TaxID=6523 RepID=A0AAV2H9V4_LYMST